MSDTSSKSFLLDDTNWVPQAGVKSFSQKWREASAARPVVRSTKARPVTLDFVPVRIWK